MAKCPYCKGEISFSAFFFARRRWNWFGGWGERRRYVCDKCGAEFRITFLSALFRTTAAVAIALAFTLPLRGNFPARNDLGFMAGMFGIVFGVSYLCWKFCTETTE